MKKHLFTLFLALLSLSAGAEEAAVSMQSFEQGWSDPLSTIALKNNTQEQIHSVQFIVEYLDMNGNQMDYQEYNEEVEIAPGMTRKVSIPAYEHMRNYSYYKSEKSFSDPHLFKVKYDFESYNNPGTVAKTQTEEDWEAELDKSLSSIDSAANDDTVKDALNLTKDMLIWYIVIVLIVLLFSVGLYVLVAVVAHRNHRNVILWVLLSCFVSPIIVLIILLCIGENQSEVI